jgi:hypothetical protein
MNFQEIWAHSSPEEEVTPDRAALSAMLSKESRGLLTKLRNQLRNKLYYGLSAMAITMFAIYKTWGDPMMMTLTWIMLLMAALLTGVIYHNFRRLPNLVDMSEATLPMFKRYHSGVKRILRLEELIGAFFVVPAPAIGGLFGFASGIDRDSIELLAEPWSWVALAALMYVIGPIAVWLSVWMNQIAFGKFLNHLQKNIDSLEAMEG